jgi:hypothetical protein
MKTASFELKSYNQIHCQLCNKSIYMNVVIGLLSLQKLLNGHSWVHKIHNCFAVQLSYVSFTSSEVVQKIVTTHTNFPCRFNPFILLKRKWRVYMLFVTAVSFRWNIFMVIFVVPKCNFTTWHSWFAPYNMYNIVISLEMRMSTDGQA